MSTEHFEAKASSASLARVPQHRRLGLVFLESQSALAPWAREMTKAATEFLARRRRHRNWQRRR